MFLGAFQQESGNNIDLFTWEVSVDLDFIRIFGSPLGLELIPKLIERFFGCVSQVSGETPPTSEINLPISSCSNSCM